MRIRMSWPVALQLKGADGATGPTGPGNSVYNDAWIKSNFIDPPSLYPHVQAGDVPFNAKCTIT